MSAQPGEMHPVDEAFYRLTVMQRDAAWREIEKLKTEIVRLLDLLAESEVSR